MTTKNLGGFTVFPGDKEKSIMITAHLQQSEIDSFLKTDFFAQNHDPARSYLLQVSVIGCIDYRSALNPTHHQTGFAYGVCATQADNGKTSLAGGLFIPIQLEPIPLEHLYLIERNMVDGHLFFAD